MPPPSEHLNSGCALNIVDLRTKIWGWAFLLLYLVGSIFHRSLASDARLFWSFQILAMISLPIAGYAVLILRHKLSPQDFGWGERSRETYEWKALLSDYVWLLLGWSFGLAIVARLFWLFLWPIDVAAQSMSMRPEHGIWWFAVGALWTIAPAFIEETFFRGFLWTIFDRNGLGRAHPIPYVVASGSLFGLGHLAQGLTAAATMTVIGFFLGWHYSKVRRVLPFVLSHLSVNLFVLFIA